MTISATQPVATLARIRARSDGEPVLWWWQGEVLGKRPGEIAKRLMRITGIGFNRLSRLPDGLWESRMSEAGYYIDAETGAFLDSWTNPYTGRVVSPPANRLRLRYLIEDNGYAISVPVELNTPGGSISKLVTGFPGLLILEVDGCDPVASYRVMREALAHARAGHGPALVHAHCIRPYSHSMSDDQRLYRSQAEIDAGSLWVTAPPRIASAHKSALLPPTSGTTTTAMRISASDF